jgi:hypothetical protein
MTDIAQTPTEALQKISKHQFYFETGLYLPLSVTDLEDGAGTFSGEVDAYNSHDGFDTTYSISTSSIGEQNWDAFKGFKRITLECKRGGATRLRFVILWEDKQIIKVGQFPSLADIQYAEIGKRYNKHLTETDLRNYKKAIGLYAHGAGAGSFVYLRRIFENLIFETFELHKEVLNTDPVDFKQKRMEEKVELLKVYLPSQLLEMKVVYGILSKGVHELSEEECLKYFAPIKLSIELILDQKIKAAQKSERDRVVKLELRKIQQTLSGIDDNMYATK